MRLFISCSLVALLLASCSSTPSKSDHAKEQLQLSQMIYSPNGEPLNGGPLGRPTCQEALTKWFDRTDTNHDGSLSRLEFLADASASFLRMDIDHNGFLVSEELERYRKPYRQEAAATKPKPSDAEQQATRRKHAHGGNPHDVSDEPAADTTDPVMAADTDLNFKVLPGEFIAHAGNVFTTLDKNGDGMLGKDEVLARCQTEQ